MVKIVIIGLDGATWKLFDNLIEKNFLPNLNKVIKKGIIGNLESTNPPVTAPAWVSFATGKNPGKHGCYDFILPRNSLDYTRTISSKDISGLTFYEILNLVNHKGTIINLPNSFPPRTNWSFRHKQHFPMKSS